MNDFDKAARFAAKRLDPLGFLLWLMGATFGVAWRWVNWLDTQAVPFPGEPDRRCDTVAAFESIVGDQPPLAVVVEFMSETRRAILERLVGYQLQIRFTIPYQEGNPVVRYDVIGVVVNLSGESLSEQWNMTPADCGGLGLRSKAKVRNLESQNSATVLRDIDKGKTARCVLPWIVLMKNGDTPKTIETWKRLAELEPDAQKKRWYAGLLLVFAGLVNRHHIWKRALEGWNVKRSEITLEWEADGELRATKRSLLRVLKARLQQEVPAAAVEIIEAQETLPILETWIDRSSTISTLDELNALLGRNGH